MPVRGEFFEVGARVKPNRYAIEHDVVSRAHAKRVGTVTGHSRQRHPLVLWDGLKTAQSWHPDYLERVTHDAAPSTVGREG